MPEVSWVTLRRALTVAIVAIVPLATVGPNLGEQGVRTEHVCAVVAALGLLLIHGGLPQLPTVYWLTLLAWTAILMITLIVELIPMGPAGYPPIQIALGRFAVPLLGLVVGAYVGSAASDHSWPGRSRRLSLLEILMVALVVVACANTAVAIASAAGEVPWLELFRSDSVKEFVGERAAQGGRYGGVVNQPVEAGMLYSIALLTVARLWITNVITMGWFIGLAATVGTGAVMSGSKAFLFGGLPVALAYILFSTRQRLAQRLAGVGLAAGSALLAAWYVLIELNQQGLERISANYLPWSLESPLSTLFAGRLDTGGKTMRAWETLLRETGPFSLGAPPTGAYDIGAMEFASVAGWAGVALMVLIAAVLLAASVSGGREAYWPTLTILALATNLGGPAFTANRVALVLWVLFGAMLQLSRTHPRTAKAPAGITSREIRVS